MPHELKESPEAIELSVSAPDREGLFREALEGVLEAVYGATLPAGLYEGRVVPVQAAGESEDALFEGLVKDTLRAVREEPGTIHPPRWLSFDEKRVTATLPLHSPRAESRPLELLQAGLEASSEGLRARVVLVPAEGA